MAAATTGCSDEAFGPASCIRSFDFTLTFEQSILSILPSALLLLVAPPRLFQLFKRRSRTDGHGKRFVPQAMLAAANSALQLVIVILWSPSPCIQTSASLPSAALSFAGSVMILCLSYFELEKATRPSSLLTVYLLFSAVFDATQVRTLWLAQCTSIAAVQSASIVLRTVLLCLESRSKASYLKPPYRDYPPEAQSGIFNLSFVWWLNQLFVTGFRKLMTTSDLFALHPKLRSEVLGKRLQAHWHNHAVTRSQHALPKALLACLKWDLLVAVFPRLFMTAFRFAQPFLITSAINYVEEPESTSNINYAYGLIGATFFVYLGISISTVHFKQCFSLIVANFRGSVISLIYNETLTIQEGISADSAALTLMSTDVDNIIEFLENIYDIWACVLEVAIGTWLLERQLGATCVVPVIVVLACFGGQTLVAKTIGKDQQKWNQAIQTRVKNTSKMLGSIKAIKISGYADVLRSNLQNERRQELKTSGPFFMGIVWLNTLSSLPAVWSPVITFIVFAVQASLRGRQPLTTVQAFTSLSIITLVTSPAANLLALLPQIAAAMGCFERIQDYLLSEKRADSRLLPLTKFSTTFGSDGENGTENIELQAGSTPLLLSGMVRFDNATISPAPKVETVAINKATFTIPKASFTVLIGPVGSGKTTLLKAILGELSCQSGSVSVGSTSISYCSQTSFVLNDTIKKNICGPSGLAFDDKWYTMVMNACDLGEDVQRWSDGDDTVVGSKGLKLSGGQKQRLALARAVYARRDIVLLDDTLSALDNKTQEIVNKQLFSNDGIFRRLGMTVVLATHSTRSLRLADQIIVLDREGNPTVLESYEALLDNPSGAGLATPFDETSDEVKSSEELSSGQFAPKSCKKTVPDDKLMDLTRRTGDFRIYSYYLQTIGWPLSIIFLAANAVAALAHNFPQVWLQWWAAANGEQLSKYLSVYAVLALAATLSTSICIWVVFLRMMPKSAAQLHENLLHSVMGAPLFFFASTDSGVTLNRFSQDMSLVDLALPIALLGFVMACFEGIAKVGLIATGSSYMAISLPFAFVAIFFIQHVYLKTSRQLRYLDLENKSPLYSHFTETLEGLATIRAFGWEREAMEKQVEILDHSQKPYYMLLCVQRWLGLVLDLMVTVLAVMVITLAVNLRTTTTAGLLGIALNSSLSFSQSLSSIVVSWTSLETSLGAIARVKTFAATTPSENKPDEDQSPLPGWPASGTIELRNVSVEYDDGNPALDSVSMTIAPGQKIGICGRTGSGKSTLLLALLRLVSPTTGSIFIDGVDIRTFRPDGLRSRLIAVPQDSFTMSGNVRSNVDPFGAISDTEIVSTLKKVHIWAALESRGGLDAMLLDQPLSQGEQQLLCLARAMLRRSTVLILDEATSSVDNETDHLLQKVIMEEFAECTVISVAHRLDTILSSDKIAVLDAGRLVEFDSPKNLLAKNSMFLEFTSSGLKA